MRELRLTDPDGYTVPGAVTVVPDDQTATATTALQAQAATDAADWGHDTRGYDIQNTPA